MEIAYQTPKLSQFHIGFRYERKNHDNTWTKTEFTTKDNLAYFETCLNDGTFRVKSLSHNCIKEAGWEESIGTTKIYLLGRYFLCLENDKVRIMVRHQPDLFKGKIANYNKLLDVMEMLGIKG